jgi:hypothetical protein
MFAQMLPFPVLGSEIQEPVTKDDIPYMDVITKAENSGANHGNKITTTSEITLNNKKVGNIIFNKNNPYIEIVITSNVEVDIMWNCASKYANCTLNGAGTYKIPRLLQNNGKLQSFNALWLVDVRLSPIVSSDDDDGVGLSYVVDNGMGCYDSTYARRGVYVEFGDDFVSYVVAMGVRSSGGYSISIVDVFVDVGGNVVVLVSERSPGFDDFVSMAITYPVCKLVLDGVPDSIVVRSVGGEVFEVVSSDDDDGVGLSYVVDNPIFHKN